MHTLAIFVIAYAFIVFVSAVFTSKHDPVPETKYPIKYPIEPMFENYADIKEEIIRCEDKEDLKKAYVRIIIFSGCYPDGQSFLSELHEQYEIQQEILHIYY